MRPSWTTTTKKTLSLREATVERLERVRRALRIRSLALQIDLLVSSLSDEELSRRIEGELVAEGDALNALRRR